MSSETALPEPEEISVGLLRVIEETKARIRACFRRQPPTGGEK